MSRDLNIIHLEVVYEDVRFRFYLLNRTDRKYSEKVLETDSPVFTYHAHSYYELHYLTKGKTVFLFDEEPVPFQQGELMLFSPGKRHLTYLDGEWETAVVAFELEKTVECAHFYPIVKDALEQHAEMPLSLSQELQQYIDAFSSFPDQLTREEQCRSKLVAYQLVYQLLKDLGCFAAPDLPLRETRSEQETRVLLDDLLNAPHSTLQSIAEALGYSLRHTSRLIKLTYGASFSQLRSSMMLETAVRLMEKMPEADLEEIAQLSGFSSGAALTRAMEKGSEEQDTE